MQDRQHPPGPNGGGQDARRGVVYGAGRQALLEAAIAVVARGGLRKLTWRAVAQEAGVTHGLVAHHFGSRDALISAALELAAQRNIEASRLQTAPEHPEQIAADLIDMAMADHAAQAFQYELVLEARRTPELIPHVIAMLATYRSNVREALVAAGLPDDEPLADLVFAALDGLTFGLYADGDPARARAALLRLQQILGKLHSDQWRPPSASSSSASAAVRVGSGRLKPVPAPQPSQPRSTDSP